MKTAGQILHQARVAKKIDLEEVARITKIRQPSLRYLEADDYRHLPSGTVARGFIRNYAEFLGLNPEQLLAVFRRDFIENAKGEILPRGMVEPVNQGSFWTPRTTIIALVTIIFTLFAGYLVYQYRQLVSPPVLEIMEPQANSQVADQNVEVVGRTDPEATISVNGSLVALDKGGHFSFRIPIQSGQNSIVITATGKSGKTTSVTRVVTLTSTP